MPGDNLREMDGEPGLGFLSSSLDTHRSNAYSEAVKFDMDPKYSPGRLSPPVTGATDINRDDDRQFDAEISVKSQPPKDWELDVKGMISTRKWLQNYGLKRNRLDIHHLLPQIGFKHSDEFDHSLKKPISSKYGDGLFNKYFRSDGKTYNVSCTKEKLKQLEARLTQAISLYKRRLEWLTTESRRIFGVVEEKSIAIVVDIKNMSPQQFDQYRSAMERVLREQVSQIAKFNIMRAAEDLDLYSPDCVPVTQDSLEGAVKWLWDLDRLASVSDTATCEAVFKAMSDPSIEAVYLFTEGSAAHGSKELLKEKLTGGRLPLHVVSYNCTDANTVKFLKELASITGGKFHAYAVVMEMDSYEGDLFDKQENHSNIILKRKTYGGVPPGSGTREDVILLFEELEEARNTLAQIQVLMDDAPNPRSSIEKPPERNGFHEKSEQYMSSREWLEKYGLKSKKLGFFDILSGVAFKHRDGVVNLKGAPGNHQCQTDAVTNKKLVNARYCDKFPVVRWKDGQVVHVQVTPEIHRSYETRMKMTIDAIQQRIDWLQQGSRELFGTVIEDQIYILVDTSESMNPHMQFVKDKLFVLMQEQLRHKQKFNLIGFDTKSVPWRDRMMDVNEKNLSNAWMWIKGLTCRGSTNTLAALRHALGDTQTHAIYLLTDGRPDQPPKSILAQVQLSQRVPIHTISFNCADRDANEFLCQLAKDTGGRFHYYSENGMDPDGPDPWESEDVRLLKQELQTGYRNLEKIAMLRDECARMAWRKDEFVMRKGSKGRESAVPPMDPKDLYRANMERPTSAPGHRQFHPAPPMMSGRPGSAHANKARSFSYSRPKSATTYSTKTKRPLVAANSEGHHKRITGNIAGHTRTSILRTLGSSGQFSAAEWLLPETRDLFDKQWQRQKKMIDDDDRLLKKRAKKKKKFTDPKKISSKRWLATNGLKAKKMTIVDALAPTFIPHKASYVPILDKTVLSKVFDEHLPIAHAEGERKSIRLVNPQGVNLEAYEDKVVKQQAKYKRRLNRIVWEALPDNEKEQFGSEKPISFEKNKKEMMEALDRCGWPVSEYDIVHLENEINKAQSYIEQARKLRKVASEGGRITDEDSQADDSASVASSASGGGGGEGKDYEVSED